VLAAAALRHLLEARGDVVASYVAKDVVKRISARGEILSVAADYEGELAFVVHALQLGCDGDVLVGSC